jgi:hypothetical protein
VSDGDAAYTGGAVGRMLMMCVATTHCAVEADPFGTGMFFLLFQSSRCLDLTCALCLVDDLLCRRADPRADSPM